MRILKKFMIFFQEIYEKFQEIYENFQEIYEKFQRIHLGLEEHSIVPGGALLRVVRVMGSLAKTCYSLTLSVIMVSWGPKGFGDLYGFEVSDFKLT
jgi:hypothetical protein